MKQCILVLSLFTRLFSQTQYTIPFDWGGQNGLLIQDGALFWNRSWTSGVLLFDGTYASYPKRYGSHTSKQFSPIKMGTLPVLNELPDSSRTISYFDYSRGDYNYDKLALGANYEARNQFIKINGFKRTHSGNTGHYFHPNGGQSPIHHSYRIDYGITQDNRRIEAGVGRFITRSGIPDSTQNGLENENIITAGLRVEQSLGDWLFRGHFAQFSQHRLVHHSSLIDSNYRDINRNLFNFQLELSEGVTVGVQQQSQHISTNIQSRSLLWTKIYGIRIFGKLSLLGGVQILNSDDAFPFVWELDYNNKFGSGYLQLHSQGSPSPKHPKIDDPSDKSAFEYWNRTTLKGGINTKPMHFSVFLNATQKGVTEFSGSNILFVGGNIDYTFRNGWSIFLSTMTQLDSSHFGAGGGTHTIVGLKGKLNFFKKNMRIDSKLWANGTNGRIESFGFDPIHQMPFKNTNSTWILRDFWLFNFEAVANISGVLVTYKINNILNAVGESSEKVWFRPNHVYPQLGRMIQFGVTWYFNN